MGRFRRAHVAVGAGDHQKISDSPYTFSRTYEDSDQVVIALDASGAINVGSVFSDDTTVRDAYFHEYWPIVIEDATMQAGPVENQAASLFNIKTFFGWVTSSEKFHNSFDKKPTGK